jgi:hypothetical protein
MTTVTLLDVKRNVFGSPVATSVKRERLGDTTPVD